MKRLFVLLICLVFTLSACGTANSAVSATDSSLNTSKTIVLTADSDYPSRQYTLNADSDMPTVFSAFEVPVGTYTAKNVGAKLGQINVIGSKVEKNEDGVEEVADWYLAESVKAGQSIEITIGENQYVKISGNSKFELTPVK